MRMHWQDLNDSPIKKYWKHGRAWIGWFSFEWSIPTHFWHFSFGVNGGDGNNKLTFSFAVGIFSIHMDCNFWSFPFGHWSTYLDKPIFLHEEREFEFSIHDSGIWWKIWGDPMGGWSRDMAYHLTTHSFHPIDFFFGQPKYSNEILEKGETLIPMLEGSYPATYELFVSTWKRPRSFFKKQLKRITINIPKGIPHEGKGENSWDCGEDGTFGITCLANNLEEGIGTLVGSCLRDRKKYGGKHTHREIEAIIRR